MPFVIPGEDHLVRATMHANMPFAGRFYLIEWILSVRQPTRMDAGALHRHGTFAAWFFGARLAPAAQHCQPAAKQRQRGHNGSRIYLWRLRGRTVPIGPAVPAVMVPLPVMISRVRKCDS